MSVRTVLVCEAQVPFVRGGAELLVEQLVSELRARGVEAERVALPYKWYPKEQILAHAAAWRLLDLSGSNHRDIDLVIATKFPTYFARHSKKVCWLVHQHRAAYELTDTIYSDFGHDELDVGLRQRLMALDEQMLGECRGLYTISETVSARLRQFNGIESTPLYHPPALARRLTPGPYGDYILSVARIEGNKRIDLAVRALTAVPAGVRLVIVGVGSHRGLVEKLAEDLGVRDRVTFTGNVSDEELIRLYREALALVYVPFDEDYGLATLEAFLAEKPVITARDSGGTLEFVENDVNGFVVEPEADAIAGAVTRLVENRTAARSLGQAGAERARLISWDGVVSRLLSHG